MICQKCGKRNVTHNIIKTINGVKTEKYLCSVCAAEENHSLEFSLNTQNMFSNFFGNPVFGDMNNIFGIKQVSGNEVYPETLKKICPLCGSSYNDLLASGKVGCAKCYDTFAEQLQKAFAQYTEMSTIRAKYAKIMQRQLKSKSKFKGLKIKCRLR